MKPYIYWGPIITIKMTEPVEYENESVENKVVYDLINKYDSLDSRYIDVDGELNIFDIDNTAHTDEESIFHFSETEFDSTTESMIDLAEDLNKVKIPYEWRNGIIIVHTEE